MNYINHDIIDPKQKRKKILEKADIINICTSTEKKAFQENDKFLAKEICDNCGADMHLLYGGADIYACDSCGCLFERNGSYKSKTIWFCIYNPEQF